MREPLTRARLLELMSELARSAPRTTRCYSVYFVGGGSAVWWGWRESSLDADLSTDDEVVLRPIQQIKERLNLNVEIARPDHFVPPLDGAAERHVFIERIEPIDFYHFDPYSQLFAKIVRGFERDLADAHHFVESGLVDPQRLRELVRAIPQQLYARYPRISAAIVQRALDAFLAALR